MGLRYVHSVYNSPYLGTLSVRVDLVTFEKLMAKISDFIKVVENSDISKRCFWYQNVAIHL